MPEALAAAELDPADVGYVEAHGSGTPLGDAIEVGALRRGLRRGTARRRPCALGSVKTNIGNLDAAAGVAGLIKAVLAVRHGVGPGQPALHRPAPGHRPGRRPVPACRPRRSAGRTAAAPGGRGQLVRAGRHQRARAWSSRPRRPSRPTRRRAVQLLPLSARTPAALRAARPAGRPPRRAPPAALADVAATLATGPAGFGHRAAVVATDPAEAVAGLRRAGDPGARWPATPAAAELAAALGGRARRRLVAAPASGARHHPANLRCPATRSSGSGTGSTPTCREASR